MIHLKSAREIEQMAEAGRLLACCHREIKKKIRPGITTKEIDEFVERYLAEHGATPEQKGYQGYPYATCASVNDVICHGFPSAKPLQSGDIVTIDMVVNLNGWLADSACLIGLEKFPMKRNAYCKRRKKPFTPVSSKQLSAIESAISGMPFSKSPNRAVIQSSGNLSATVSGKRCTKIRKFPISASREGDGV